MTLPHSLFRKPNAALENFAGGERPIGRKSSCNCANTGLQLENANRERGFGFFRRARCRGGCSCRGERRSGRPQQNLSVIAKIDGGYAPRREQRSRQEILRTEFSPVTACGDGRPRIARAGASMRTRTRLRYYGPRERVHKLFATGVVFEMK